MQATVNGFLHVSTVVQTSINCTCIPAANSPCPTALSVAPDLESAAAMGVQAAPNVRVRGKPAAYILDRSPPKTPEPRKPGVFVPKRGPDYVPRFPLRRAPAGTKYYHITSEQLQQISKTKYGPPPKRDPTTPDRH